MFKILRRPYAVALAATNLLVRLAGGAVALALVLFAEGTRGSFTAAGLLAGSFAVGTAAGAPVTGRLVDRLGATRVLLATAAVHAAALLAVAALPAIPLPAAAALAVIAGAARPPVGAWMRGIWAAILDNDRDRQASYRFESALLEVGFIAGPLIAGLVAALGRPALGLVLTAVTAAAASTVFALLPPSRAADPRYTVTGRRSAAALRTTADPRHAATDPRSTAALRTTTGRSSTTGRVAEAGRAGRAERQPPRPATEATATPAPGPDTTTTRPSPSHDAPRPPAHQHDTGDEAGEGRDNQSTQRDMLGALRSPAIRTLVVSRTALGVTLGALQVTAAGYATAHGRPGFAGILLGALAVGSLAGSVALRLRPTALAAVMCAVLVPLFAPAGLWWLAILFAIAGAPVAPLNAVAYEITERAAPPGTATEARMWTSTATMAGTALGTAIAGAAVEQWSPRAALLTALTGAILALTADATTRTSASPKKEQADPAPVDPAPVDPAPAGAAPHDAGSATRPQPAAHP
ncbi:MFS transporter [Dactylosporangium sp. NPDC000244]|uniref:MFS transporter n=1 Tax=Dactylosporangium sp. NPDC000244 TaxID=3154365 RepID=UPI0033322E53